MYNNKLIVIRQMVLCTYTTKILEDKLMLCRTELSVTVKYKNPMAVTLSPGCKPLYKIILLLRRNDRTQLKVKVLRIMTSYFLSFGKKGGVGQVVISRFIICYITYRL